MALPLMTLSIPALDDDDELQESTDGRLRAWLSRNLNRMKPKSKTQGAGDYKSPAWQRDAKAAGICALPTALGGRMLHFRGPFVEPMGQKQHELRIGLCERTAPDAKLESDVVSITVSPFHVDTFNALFYDSRTAGSQSRGVVVRCTLSFNAQGTVIYGSMHEKSGAPPLHVRYDQALKSIIETVSAYVNPGNGLDEPNDFEKVYDPDFKNRTLAKFLRGGLTS